MRQSNLLFTILALLMSFSAAAQIPGKLTGKVNNNSSSPVSAATVSLLKATDSSLVKMVASDASGNFEFNNILKGKYLLSVSAVGHQRTISQSFDWEAANGLDLPVITLQPQSKDLGAVTVSATRALVEQKIDRTILNVDAAVSNVGANALEVLEKAPGVQVDKDGNISLKGKQGVMVLLDGRPAYLSGAELANMLRAMQASQLDQIEIMTNPPAKYDAAGNSGIINIKTKKNKVKGFNGNFTAGYGHSVYFKTNESLSLNYRNNRFNIFSSLSFGRNDTYQQLDIYRRFKNEDKSTRAIFEQSTYMFRRNLNTNAKLGIDYALTNKTTVGLVLNGFYNPNSMISDNTSFLKNPAGVTDSVVKTNNYNKELWKNGSVNLNMRHQFDTTGRDLSIDLDYVAYGITRDQLFNNFIEVPPGQLKSKDILKGDIPATIDIYSIRIDYSQPLDKKSKLEFGVKSSYVTNDSKADYFNGTEDAKDMKWSRDLRKSVYFQYKENINAGYINLNRQFTEKFSVQAGLRYENTNYKGLQYGNPSVADSSFKRSYGSLFPTVYFSYTASKSSQFGLSWGRRIDRPQYQNLNPFLFFIDKYTFESGNPYLRPQFSNNIELTHIFKGKLTTTLNYSVTKDMINETFDQATLQNAENNFATIVRKGNIGKRENAGISVSLQVSPVKWWSANIYTNYNYSRFSGPLNGEYINIEAGNVQFNMNNQFKFGKGWSAEVSGWARTKGIEGQIQIDPMGMLAAGVSKQILKGKGSLKLNVRDIFHTQIPKGDINFKSTEAKFKNTRETRVANLTFSYRFGKQFKPAGNQSKKGGPEELNRVGGNN